MNNSNLTTYKQKLQMDMKTVLSYQLAANEGLQYISPSLTINDLKKRTKEIYSYKEQNRHSVKYFDFYEPISSIDELFKYKEMKMIKYLPDDFKADFVICEDYKEPVKYKSKSDFINELMKILINMKYGHIDLNLFKRNYNVYKLSCRVKETVQNRKHRIQYLKEHLKTTIKYQTTIGCSLDDLRYGFNTEKGMLNEIEKHFVPYTVKMVNIERLRKMNIENMTNLSIDITIINKPSDSDMSPITVYSLKEVDDILKEKTTDEHDIIVMYRKYYDDAKQIIQTKIEISAKYSEYSYDSTKRYIDEMPILKDFDDYIFTHGLDAFNHYIDTEDKIKYIINNPQSLICCAWNDQHIGDYGLYVKGDCRLASQFDINSEYSEKDHRRFVSKFHYNDDWLIKSPKEIVYCKIYNGEAIVENVKIVGLWCTDYAKDWEEIQLMKDLTGIDNVKIITSDTDIDE